MPDIPQIHTIYRRTEKLAEAALQEVVTVLSKETAAPLLGIFPLLIRHPELFGKALAPVPDFVPSRSESGPCNDRCVIKPLVSGVCAEEEEAALCTGRCLLCWGDI